eukprot:10123519-Alexandrium_andersonii.AAC.1
MRYRAPSAFHCKASVPRQNWSPCITRSSLSPYPAASWTRSARVPWGGRSPGTRDVRASCTDKSRTASSGW